MNTYTTEFFSLCPTNGVRIKYTLKITTGAAIPVEQILAGVDLVEGFHEDIADQLQQRFGGSQTLTADHHGVRIETLRPMLAHWSGPAG